MTAVWSEGFSQPRGVAVNHTGLNTIGDGRAGQEMVNANTVIALPAPGLIIPETVMTRLVGVQDTKRIGQPHPDQLAVSVNALRLIQGITGPFCRVGGIDGGRDNIIITANQERDLPIQ